MSPRGEAARTPSSWRPLHAVCVAARPVCVALSSGKGGLLPPSCSKAKGSHRQSLAAVRRVVRLRARRRLPFGQSGGAPAPNWLRARQYPADAGGKPPGGELGMIDVQGRRLGGVGSQLAATCYIPPADCERRTVSGKLCAASFVRRTLAVLLRTRASERSSAVKSALKSAQ